MLHAVHISFKRIVYVPVDRIGTKKFFVLVMIVFTKGSDIEVFLVVMLLF